MSRPDRRPRPAAEGSFALLLAQAVDGGDSDLLEFIFSHRDAETARETLAGLRQPSAVARLLRLMLGVIEDCPSKAAGFVFWLRALLLEKGALLDESALRLLQSKKHFFAAKAENVCRLLALRGRLALATGATAAPLLEEEPLVVADERTEEEEGAEGEKQPAEEGEGAGEEELGYEAAAEEELEGEGEGEEEMQLEEESPPRERRRPPPRGK